MGKLNRLITFLVLSLLSNVSLKAQIANKVFKESIKTGYLSQGLSNEYITENPCFSIDNQENWNLQFDDLSLQSTSYSLRIIHCQADWKPSNLSEIEYLEQFNDIPLRNTTSSMGTKIPYQHFQINLPKTRVSGNFIAMIYANRNKRDTILTRRYSIYQNEMTVAGKMNFAKTNTLRNTHQALEINLLYPDNYLISSEDDIRIEVRKNNQSENQIKSFPRPIINSMERRITFPFYNQENSVPGGNEYRMIDARSSQQKLSYVASLQTENRYTEIIAALEQPQGNYSYVQRPDFNGAFVISNYENPSQPLMCDYMWCQFNLKSAQLSNEKIYVLGAFNSFVKNTSSEMIYNSNTGVYSSRILIKQGIYNYLFASNATTNTSLEGNHAQTENQYEVLVYFKKPGQRNDSLVSYQKIHFP